MDCKSAFAQKDEQNRLSLYGFLAPALDRFTGTNVYEKGKLLCPGSRQETRSPHGQNTDYTLWGKDGKHTSSLSGFLGFACISNLMHSNAFIPVIRENESASDAYAC